MKKDSKPTEPEKAQATGRKTDEPEHSMEKLPGSSGPNDSLDIRVKAPLALVEPVTEGEFAPAKVNQDYEYVAGDGSE